MATSVRPDEYAAPLLVSVGLHVVVIVLLLTNLTRCDNTLVLPAVPEHVRAVVIEKPSRQPALPERSVLEKVEIPDIVVPPPLEAPKEPPKLPSPAASEKGIAKPEQARPTAQEKPKTPAPPDFSELLAQEEKSTAQREQLRREQAERADKAEREASMRAAQNQKTVNDYTALIAAEVQRRWIKPPAIKPGLFAEFRIRLLPGGEMLDVRLTKSSGDPLFDKSAETAIRNAGRLPVPADPALFASAFRQFSFRFKPEDTRQ
jgi:colicin import membrane protein